MFAFKKYVSLALVATSLSVLAVACGESKVAQCNKFSEIANKGQSIFAGKSAPKNASDIGQIADQMDKLKGELDGLKFSDEKLQSFQKQYSELFSGLVTDMRGLAKAFETKNMAELQKISKNMSQVAPKGAAIDVEFKKYCSS
jgi:DNA repair ATPase RecN